VRDPSYRRTRSERVQNFSGSQEDVTTSSIGGPGTRHGEHHRANPDDDELMGEINAIFRISMSITLKTQGKKLKWVISLAQRIESRRNIKWSDEDISFGPENHPETELSERNLSFVIKVPIGWHKVAKILIDSGALSNLIVRKTFIEMCLNLKDFIPVHDTFHRVITRQSSTLIGCIDLEVSFGTWDNKCMEMLTFEVVSFDIGYNCILGRPFLLKFMAVIHTGYATMKMPGPKGVITIKADQRDTLACENATLTHAGQFSKKAEQVAKVVKTQDGSTLLKSPTPKPLTFGTPRPPSTKKRHLSFLNIKSAAHRPTGG
jgi:hypothetical protein